jgi:hypothetical protein
MMPGAPVTSDRGATARCDHPTKSEVMLTIAMIFPVALLIVALLLSSVEDWVDESA